MTASASVTQTQVLTDTILQVFLQLKQGSVWSYTAGQYLLIHLDDKTQAAFSIANAPLGSGLLECHIRHTQDNQIANRIVDHIRQHGELEISGPFGEMTYNKRRAKPTLLIAGGTGFAPMKALIEQALINQDPSPLHLLWCAKSKSDLYLEPLATQWRDHCDFFNYTPILGQTDLTPTLNQHYPTLKDHQIFSAGPIELVKHTKAVCMRLGLTENCFFSDFD